MNATQELICKAIKEKRVIEFRYKLERRRAEPHTLGFDKKETLVLCAWSRSVLKPGFRDFHVTKLSELTITDETFERPRPGYNRNDTTLSRVLCRL